MKDNCDMCFDTGLAIVDGVVYRCYCSFGDTHPTEIYAPRDKEKLYPIKIPRLAKPKPVGREAAAGKD